MGNSFFDKASTIAAPPPNCHQAMAVFFRLATKKCREINDFAALFTKKQ
jgi:retron-type reverse transcriptase